MSNTSTSSGIGFSGMLAILFIGLKLAGIIDWSWWWVLSPMWIPLAILAVFFAIPLIFWASVTTLILILKYLKIKKDNK
jgi:hypothetical protein